MNNDINTITTELYHEWMKNTDTWFSENNETDLYYTNKYYYKLLYFNLDDLLEHIKIINNKEIIIGSILLLDQIPRHYNRLHDITINCNIYTFIASKIADIIILKDFHFTAYDNCFIYLPYRHLLDINKIQYIIHLFIQFYIKAPIHDKNIYKKYLNATLHKIYKHNTAFILKKQIFQKKQYNDWMYFQEVLEFIPKNIYKNTETILFHKVHDYDNTTIIVSLSGGVDSNVLLYILKQYYNNIIAVHVNYNNNKTSKLELKFVKTYCSSLNIKLYHRTINEINRNSCRNNGLRDIYEDITQKIRFDLYKQVANEPFVALGHNKDDCFENIITNIIQKKNYNNLYGMNNISLRNEITFWRPLLNVSKKEIIQFAFNHNIPFLQDSTPKWCMRGKIRDCVNPCFNKFDTKLKPSMFNLADNLIEMNHIIDTITIPAILKLIELHENEIMIHVIECNYNLMIWKKILNSPIFIATLHNKKCSNKSIIEFVKYINRRNSENIFIFTKSMKVQYHTNYVKFIISPIK
jgi:tRNA(Ile)-lysidine synthetase-like protein